jgi:asparagine synthase (glutamine-hydrolysing)
LGGVSLAVGPRGAPRGEPSVVVAADARLDNRAELIVQLRPDTAAAASGAELILAAYLAWGEDCARHLLGDFAFAIWDAGLGRMLCGRDQIGIAPLYFHLAPDRLVFASDIRAVIAHPQTPRALSEREIVRHLRFAQYAAPETTFFAAVAKLPAARGLAVTADAQRTRAYWSPLEAPAVRLAAPADYAERLGELLDEAVACRLPPAGPVGVHASGGLDSSAIALLAQRRLAGSDRPLVGFSWLPRSAADAERAIPEQQATARLAACGLAIEHVDPSEDDMMAWLAHDVAAGGWSDLVYEWPVRRLAQAAGVAVMLSGWGGDEVASGGDRGQHAALFWSGRWAALGRRLAEDVQGHPRPWLGRLGQLHRQVWRASLPDRVAIGPHPLDMAAKTGLRRGLVSRYPRQDAGRRGPPSIGVAATQARRLTDGHLQMRTEAWAAQGAVDGVTYRYPMLDRRVLELCLGAPPEVFTHPALTRPLMRQALDGIVPDAIRMANTKAEPVRVARLVDLRLAAAERWLAERSPAMGDALERAERYFDVAQLRRPPPTEAARLDRLARAIVVSRQIQVVMLLHAYP